MNNKILKFLLIIFISFVSIAATPNNFYEAKIIARELFLAEQETVYSGCTFDLLWCINFSSCNFKPEPNIIRDHKIEFEHVFPMAHAKYHFSCWQNKLCTDKHGHKYGGRKCCKKIEPKFQQLEGELYNIWPEIGSINQARNNFKFTEFSESDKKRLGKYREVLYIDFKQKRVEPRNKIKGIVARANLFIAEKYHIHLSKAQRKLFEAWNKKYPPEKMELIWANRITKITGYSNHFITER